MSKNYNFKEEILKDSETEIQLKSYLSKLNMFLGEEIAVSALSTRNDIVESLNLLTSKFEDKNSLEIAFILLRSAILSSNNNNYYIQVLKNKLAYGELQDMLDLVNTNVAFRKCLTKTLICQSKKTDKELYYELDNKEHVIEDLDNLKFYEQVIKEKEKSFRLVLKSK